MTDSRSHAGVSEGDLLAGKYRIEKVLGVGGMGVVVAAHHIDLDERVALKFLLPAMLHNEEAAARFAREARAAVKIKSEHVAKVTDVGKLENGAPYMVMEYLDGTDLSAWLKQYGVLAVEQSTEFVLQACEAIAEAHVLGIVHRDLKPANLFVVRVPGGALSVKVLDFGISKMTGPGSGSGVSVTKTSALMGSPLYMSPEQIQSSKDVDARADIWALGIILHELLTGKLPFGAESMAELMFQIILKVPGPMGHSRPDLPDGLEAVVLRCLDKDPGKRFQTVGQLALALLPYAPRRSKVSVERISSVMQAGGFSQSALALPPSSVPTEPHNAGQHTAASWGSTGAKSKRGGRTAITVGSSIVAVGLVAALAAKYAFGPGPANAAIRPPASGLIPPPAAASASPIRPVVAPTPPTLAPTSTTPEMAATVTPPAGPPAQSPHARPPSQLTVAPSSKSVPHALPQDVSGKAFGAVVNVQSTASPPAPPSTHSDCDPNFYFDAQGEKHFKPECFGVHPSSTHPR